MRGSASASKKVYGLEKPKKVTKQQQVSREIRTTLVYTKADQQFIASVNPAFTNLWAEIVNKTQLREIFDSWIVEIYEQKHDYKK